MSRDVTRVGEVLPSTHGDLLDTVLRQQEEIVRLQRREPSKRLSGVCLATVILGSLMMVFSFLSWMVQLMVRVSESSAERAHDLARTAIERQASTSLSGGDLLIYLGLLFAGTLIIIFVVKGGKLTP
jgi:hypothetical protein